ncbi:chlorophyll A-B binding protein [Aureococcus anophagefferens]|nr:chlorophyll A-B binding protein [Aureococcus anophagefferens]
MQKLVLALALSGARAFVAPAAPAAGVALSETKADLEALQKALPGPPNSYWDPLALGSATFDWGPQGEEATVGWLRHSEIKHGRVAMAAFVGFIAQCTPLVSGEHKYLPYKGYVAGCTPQEQWDNIPLYGKLQIFGLIGMLESYGEGAGAPDGYVHYMKGGKPGYYPPIAGRAGWGQVTLDLWDPFKLPGGPSSQSAEAKARGLKSELLNGRAAMAGIFGLISASK